MIWVRRLGHLGFLALLLWGFVARFGYTYGWADQDEWLPVVLHRLDPALLKSDWFVGLYAEACGVRELIIRLFASLGRWMPLPIAVALLYGLVFLWLADALWRWLRALWGSAAVAYIGTALTFWGALTFTLGGNRLAYSMLVPEMPAVALALTGLALFTQGRWPWAAPLIGLASWWQPLVGLQVGAVLTLSLLTGGPLDRARRLLQGLIFGLCVLAAAAPVLWPLWRTQQAWRAPGLEADLFYILAVFRNPHHYLASAFPPAQWAKFGLLLLGAALARAFGARPAREHIIGRFLGWSGCLWIASWIAVDGLKWLPMARMQWFKLSLFVPPLLVAYAAHGLWRALPGPFYRLRAWPGWAIATFAAGLTAWTWTLANQNSPFWRARLAIAGPPDAAFEALCAWARTQTEREAIFAVPPFESRWRTMAQRATVVNFPAFPYLDRAMLEWYARLQALTRIGRPRRGGYALEPLMNRGYHELNETDWRKLSDRYGVRYVVRQRAQEGRPLELPIAYANSAWVVYRIPEPSPLEGPRGYLGLWQRNPVPHITVLGPGEEPSPLWIGHEHGNGAVMTLKLRV
ncbi:MAG: DUF6798 domain-containing protein [Bacteroidota bacterium]|nr:DUF6798 domain-containing protein [Bacteroidota bacterium]MDW8286088.1 DUF6798 domain-containing protein [Bacteroidota bacterium]